ncbi:hypothetical protein Tsubulata_026924 [Turnera subulata]|uniref:Cullin N-terminal domain-containing protein n=1 Tax=Turnera subulata TaxID=218843 RepID=A0A9Q0JJL7_9ROSI|nr:hypothetical protein Tsubulata_026924 [Turnera subulata]
MFLQVRPMLDGIHFHHFMTPERWYFCDMIIEERKGKEIDRDLFESGLDFLLELGIQELRGERTIRYYEKFEQAMLAEAAAHYTRLSSQCWLSRDSFTNYMRKVDWCLTQEENRADIYPRETSETKLLEVVYMLNMPIIPYMGSGALRSLPE